MDSDSSEKQEPSRPRPTSINLRIQFGRPKAYEVELIEGVGEPHLEFNCAGEILLLPIVKYLLSLGFPLRHSIVWYFSSTAGVNVYCGNEPVPYFTSVTVSELEDTTLHLTFREALKNEFGTVFSFGVLKQELPIQQPPLRKKKKERKIGYVIEKVSKWRNRYNGIPDRSGEIVKIPLEEAANIVGISKKSLDDYLLQLRFGNKFGFNFQEHKDERIGVLRAYVKKMKALQSIINKQPSGQVPSEIREILEQPGTPHCKQRRCCVPDFAKNLL